MPVGSFCADGTQPIFHETLVTSGQEINQVMVNGGVWVDGISSQGSVSRFRANPEGVFQIDRSMIATSGPAGSAQTEADIRLFTLGHFSQNDPEIDLLTMTPYYLFSALSPEYHFSAQNYPSITQYPSFMTNLDIGDSEMSEYAAAWESGTVWIGRGTEQPKTMTILSQDNDKIYDLQRALVPGAEGDFLIALTANVQNHKAQLIYVGTGPNFFHSEPVSRFLEIDTVGTPRRMAVLNGRVVVVTNDNVARKSYLYEIPLTYSQNDGSLVQGVPHSFEMNSGIGFIDVGDFDRNGRDDLVLYAMGPASSASSMIGTIEILYADTAGHFSPDRRISHPVPSGKVLWNLDAGRVGNNLGTAFLAGTPTVYARSTATEGRGDYRVEATDTAAVPPTRDVFFLEVFCPSGTPPTTTIGGATVPPYVETALPPVTGDKIPILAPSQQVIQLGPYNLTCRPGDFVTLEVPSSETNANASSIKALSASRETDVVLLQTAGPSVWNYDPAQEWQPRSVNPEGEVVTARAQQNTALKSVLAATGVVDEKGIVNVQSKAIQLDNSSSSIKVQCPLLPTSSESNSLAMSFTSCVAGPNSSVCARYIVTSEPLEVGGGSGGLRGCTLIPEN
ncbi:MAG: VCBS repeat-containing protein [Deltaproteobacteria bacterium]|nr:VCBS repeat-containing protein [Deltaproteobacteria bacterium]